MHSTTFTKHVTDELGVLSRNLVFISVQRKFVTYYIICIVNNVLPYEPSHPTQIPSSDPQI